MKRLNAFRVCVLAIALRAAPGSALAADGAAATASAPALDVCLAEDSPPFSASRPQPGGIDFDVATALARHLQRPLHVAWVQISNRRGLDKVLRDAIQAGRCTLFFGTPVSGGANADFGKAGLTASVPYRSAGYALVSGRSGKVRTLEDARRVYRIGAVTATPADLFLFANGLARVPYGDNASLLEALSTDAVDAAVMWMPALARLVGEGRRLWPDAVRVGQLDDPGLRTEFVIAIRADSEPPSRIDAALRQMDADGEIAEIAQRHGLSALY